jgi:hypothetical protein
VLRYRQHQFGRCGQRCHDAGTGIIGGHDGLGREVDVDPAVGEQTTYSRPPGQRVLLCPGGSAFLAKTYPFTGSAWLTPSGPATEGASERESLT